MVAQQSIWQSRYYKVPRNYMAWVGIWPYHTIGSRCLRFVLVFTLSFSIFIPQVLYLQIGSTDVNDLIECVPSIMITIIFSFKLIVMMINDKKVGNANSMMKVCVKTIEEDWLSLNTDDEKNILQRHAKYGEYMTKFYANLMLVTGFFYLLKPIIMALLLDDDAVTKSSISGASKLPFHVEYGEKLDQYIYPIMIHCYVTVFAHIFSTVAVDSFYYVMVQHACGMFSIIGHSLENIGKDSDANFPLKLDKIEDNNYSIALSCLRKHLHVLEFAKLIESTFSSVFLISINFNMIIGSLCGIQVIMNLGSAKDITGPLALYVAQITHLFLQFWQAQFLLDHSNVPYESICRGRWYNTSKRCQKILLLIMNRTVLPCKITAGKILILSIESFSAVLKTTMSYFTVLRSFQ